MRILSGIVTLLLWAMPASAQVTVRAELTATDSVFPKRGRMDAYQISVTPGDSITVTVRSGSFDALVLLMDPTSGTTQYGYDVAPWRGQSAGNAVTGTPQTNGTWYVMVTSERAGLAGTELGPYELEVVRPASPMAENSVRRYPASSALKLIGTYEMERAVFDSTKTHLQRAQLLERAATAYQELGWRKHRAQALMWAGREFERDSTPASRKRAVELGHEVLREALDLKDRLLESISYSILHDAHESIDSVLHYGSKHTNLSIATTRAFLDSFVPADTIDGKLDATDPLVERAGHMDLYEFDGKKGQRVVIRFFERHVSTYSLLVSPAGDTVGSVRTAGVIEHELDTDGKWLVGYTNFYPDTGTYRLMVGFADRKDGIPDVQPVPINRAAEWVKARALIRRAASYGATPQAAPFYEQGARAFISAERPGEAALNLVISGAFVMRDDVQTALARIREGLRLAQPLGIPGVMGFAHMSLGLTFDLANQPDSAFAHLEQAASFFKLAGIEPAERQARDQIAALRSKLALKRDVHGGVSARISDDDVTWLADGKPFDGWLLAAKSGDTISVALRSAAFKPRLRVLSPAGTDTLYSAGADSATVQTVSGETGAWLVIVESMDDRRGGYSLNAGRHELSVAPPLQLREYAHALAIRDSAVAAGKTSVAAEQYRRAGDAFQKASRNRQAFMAYVQSYSIFNGLGRTREADDVLSWSSPAAWNDSLFVDGRALHSYFTGLSYAAKGQYAYAIDAYRRPFADFQRIGYRSSIWGYINYKIGDARASLGQHEQALTYYSRARLDFTNHNVTQQLPYVAHGIGAMQLELGKTTEALRSFNEALAGFRRLNDRASEGVALRSLAVLHERSERLDSAVVFYHRALEIQRALGNRRELAAIFNGMGRAHLTAGRPDSALVYHTEALLVNRQTQNRIGIGRSLYNLGRDYSHKKELLKALAYYDSASVEFGAVRESAGFEAERISMADQFASLSQDWMRAWLGRSDLAREATTMAALAVLERGRAQALIDLMRNARTRDIEPGADFQAEGRTLTQALRAKNVASLSYLVTGDSLYAFVTTPAGAVTLHRAAIADSTLTRMVSELRNSIGVDSAAVRSAGEELERNEGPGVRARAGNTSGYAAILKTLADVVLPKAVLDQLPPNTDLVIVPHGSLALVPFTALPAGDVSFGERVRIRYTPSLTALLEAESRQNVAAASNRAQTMRNALVVGNPEMPSVYNADFQKVKLSQLPGAEREGRAVAQQLKAQFLTSTEATEPAIVERMKSAPLVHLATHGFAYGSDARSRDSFIALAPSGNEDGLLTVGEVLSRQDLKLSAELVVLSACQTGLGSRKVAEGTVGLQWAFLAKGARTVLVSLWSVSDALTNQLMQSFYTNWMSGMSKAEALQKAQEEVRKTHPNPRYWAAFQLVGAN